MMLRTFGPLFVSFLGAAFCCSAAVDSGLLALIPENSQFVAGINVVASRDSDFGQYLNTRFAGEAKGLEQLTAETGFDPRRDLTSVIFAGASGTTGGRRGLGLVLARGAFDQAKIRSTAMGKGAIVQTFSGVDLYLQGSGEGQNAFAFLGDDVFATGPFAELQHAVTNHSRPAKLNPQLQQLISQAGPENDLWFASTVPVSRFASHLGSDLDPSVGGSETLQGVSAVCGGVRFGSSVQITVDAVARSDKDASAIADVLRFGASLVQMKGQSDPNSASIASALNQMLVSSTGQNVHLSLSMPETTLEQLAESGPQHHRMAH